MQNIFTLWESGRARGGGKDKKTRRENDDQLTLCVECKTEEKTIDFSDLQEESKY